MRLIFLQFCLLLSPLMIMSIYNGQDASIAEFPYQVAFKVKIDEQKKWCGGALLSKDWIITVAHCVKDSQHIFAVMGLDKTKAKDYKFALIDPANVTIHENYDGKLLKNDIALMKMTNPVELSEKVQPALLPEKDADGNYSTYERQKLYISGWGLISDTAKDTADELNYMVSVVLQPTSCEKDYKVEMMDRICAKGLGASAPCHADSGDPMVQKDDGGKNYLVGLASFGPKGACAQLKPFVFTRITSYMEWIKKHTGL